MLLRMLDRALRLAFANFSTLFFVVALVTVPLHVLHGFAFHRTVAVADFHDDIASYPEGRQIEGVGPADVRAYRLTGWVLTGIELLLLPFAVRAARRVVEVHGEGKAPGVLDAWRAALRTRIERPPRVRRALGALVLPLLLALACGWLVRTIGLVVADPMPSSWWFAPLGVIEGVSRAAGAPFFLAAATLSAHETKVSGR
jgi:hypothetical protein